MLLELAASKCMEMTDWVQRSVEDTTTRSSLELVAKKKEYWAASIMVKNVVLELGWWKE